MVAQSRGNGGSRRRCRRRLLQAPEGPPKDLLTVVPAGFGHTAASAAHETTYNWHPRVLSGPAAASTAQSPRHGLYHLHLSVRAPLIVHIVLLVTCPVITMDVILRWFPTCGYIHDKFIRDHFLISSKYLSQLPLLSQMEFNNRTYKRCYYDTILNIYLVFIWCFTHLKYMWDIKCLK